MIQTLLEGVMILWFALTLPSLLFVALDIRSTPENPVLKLGFVLVTAYTGPIGAFLYVLGCREPLPGLHERYVTAKWRQVLGSTIHCVAGDGIGILAGAIIGSLAHLQPPVEIILEYLLGFGFGWSIFQSLFMKDMSGGSYRHSLSSTFIPEMLSMNLLMSGMVPVSNILFSNVVGSHDPLSGAFWFIMSMALLTGLALAYPMNWWLVSKNLKHGMMTVRRPGELSSSGDSDHKHMQMLHNGEKEANKPVTRAMIALMAATSFLILGIGLIITWIFASL